MDYQAETLFQNSLIITGASAELFTAPAPLRQTQNGLVKLTKHSSSPPFTLNIFNGRSK